MLASERIRRYSSFDRATKLSKPKKSSRGTSNTGWSGNTPAFPPASPEPRIRAAATLVVSVSGVGSDLLAFLREDAPDIDQKPEIARYLTDSTLEEHLGLIE